MQHFSPTDDRPIWLTPAAVDALRRGLEEDGDGCFVRVTMNPQEILSPRYAIDWSDEMAPGDVSMDFDGVKVVVGMESARRLRGYVIDCVETFDGPGFHFQKPTPR